MIVLLFLLADAPIIVTEVMSNVKGSEQSCGDRNEFVEIYNHTDDTLDMASYCLDDLDAGADEIQSWENDSLLIKYPHVRIHSTLLFPHSYAVVLDREYISADTSGGNCQPYDLPDSTLILTTDDTSIGNGLQNTDPIIIYSFADACSTTFGTPFQEDGFPDDPGDGITWERIDYDLPDEAVNWHQCLDPTGCTPGRRNSTLDAHDLAVDEQSFLFIPPFPQAGEDVAMTLYVKNRGLHPADDYVITFFDDVDRDQVIDPAEIINQVAGEMVAALDSIPLVTYYLKPSPGHHAVGGYVQYAADRIPENNLVMKNMEVLEQDQKGGYMMLSPEIFTPDQSGVNDRLQIKYAVPDVNGVLTISIFTMAGTFVHSLCKNKPCLQREGVMYWDGSTGGKKLPSGMYLIYFEYRLQQGTYRVKKTAILAR